MESQPTTSAPQTATTKRKNHDKCEGCTALRAKLIAEVKRNIGRIARWVKLHDDRELALAFVNANEVTDKMEAAAEFAASHIRDKKMRRTARARIRYARKKRRIRPRRKVVT